MVPPPSPQEEPPLQEEPEAYVEQEQRQEQLTWNLARHGIRVICNLLHDESDPQNITLFLASLEELLAMGEISSELMGRQHQMALEIRSAGGLATIVKLLLHHSDNDVYDKCLTILETYFDMQEFYPGSDQERLEHFLEVGSGDTSATASTTDTEEEDDEEEDLNVNEEESDEDSDWDDIALVGFVEEEES